MIRLFRPRYLPPTRALLIAGLLWSGAAAANSQADEQRVESNITHVTVFSDRAQVTRTTDVDPGNDTRVYTFAGLPGWVDDGSVRVALPPKSGRIVDVQVQRDFLARSTDTEQQQADEAVKALEGTISALDDELKILDAQKKQIESIKVYSLEKLSRESALRDVKVENYEQVIAFISKSLRQTAAQRREVERKRAALQPELAAKRRKLNELRALTQLEQTIVSVTVQGAGDSGTLALTYMLPGATWEPAHELRTKTGTDGNVEMTSYAVVRQTSGEDWSNAHISFATQSANQAMNIPRLKALRIGETGSHKRIIQQRMSSYSRAQKAFEGQNLMWNRYQNKQVRNFEQTYSTNFREMNVIQTKTLQLFETLQRRGTTTHFRGMTRTTVRGDGNTVRVPIGSARYAADLQTVAAPEQSLNAAETLRMTNTGGQALLPGKIGLFKDGAFLGLTEVDFVAEGEPFSVFLSVADQIKISRVLDRKQSSIVRKKKTRMTVAFVVTVENLSKQRKTLSLAERIPVAETKDVKLDQVSILPKVAPNSRGMLAWDVELAPGERREFKIGYRVEYPPTLVLNARPKRKTRRHAPSPSNAPNFDFEDDGVEMQIQRMEKLF